MWVSKCCFTVGCTRKKFTKIRFWKFLAQAPSWCPHNQKRSIEFNTSWIWNSTDNSIHSQPITLAFAASRIMSSDDDSINNHYISEEEEPPKKKRKAKKDPNKPKRNMSAFFLYSNANRARIKEENPGIAFGSVVSAERLSTRVLCVYVFTVWLIGDVDTSTDRDSYSGVWGAFSASSEALTCLAACLVNMALVPSWPYYCVYARNIIRIVFTVSDYERPHLLYRGGDPPYFHREAIQMVPIA